MLFCFQLFGLSIAQLRALFAVFFFAVTTYSILLFLCSGVQSLGLVVFGVFLDEFDIGVP